MLSSSFSLKNDLVKTPWSFSSYSCCTKWLDTYSLFPSILFIGISFVCHIVCILSSFVYTVMVSILCVLGAWIFEGGLLELVILGAINTSYSYSSSIFSMGYILRYSPYPTLNVYVVDEVFFCYLYRYELFVQFSSLIDEFLGSSRASSAFFFDLVLALTNGM